MAHLTIGNTSINIEETFKAGKKKFFDEHKGKVSFDLDNAWIRIEQAQTKLDRENEPFKLTKKNTKKNRG